MLHVAHISTPVKDWRTALPRFTHISCIHKSLQCQEGLEAPDLSDVVDEIFDMAKPRSANCITLDDLIKSRTAHTVLCMLIDVNAFWLYENRENLIHYDNDNDE